MRHLTSLGELFLDEAWLTIGSFDGVHLGHRRILAQLTAGAQAAAKPAVVLTFHPHPVEVLHGPRKNYYLTDPWERAALLGECGVDYVVTLPFDHSVAITSAQRFLEQLKEHLGFTQLWVGENFALGKDREGDVPALRTFGETLGFKLHVVEPVEMGGELVSSSRIRHLLRAGDVETATRLLDRPYRLRGVVIPGDERGRSLGFPTANLNIDESRLLPASGVYVGRAQLGARSFDAVTNIGVRPTFEGQPERPLAEVHLLGFSGKIYGQMLEVRFLTRLRDEKRFASVEELVAQIDADVERTRELLEDAPPSWSSD
jgi:riboflavin kinase/FMN adenylyltransferase